MRKGRKSSGRPSSYKPEYAQLLIEHMEKGYSVESFGGVVRCCKQTIYTWEKKYPEFGKAKAIGESLSRIHWERIGILGTTGAIKGFNVAAWIFSMKNRFGWRDKIEHSGDEEKPIKAEIICVVKDYTSEPEGE